MTKREFQKIIKDALKDLPLEKQDELLDKIHYNWMNEIHNLFNKKLRDKYYKCSKCGKYYQKSKCSSTYRTEVERGVTVYVDSGYGDDDEFADVTYNVEYVTCPFCGKEKEKSKMWLGESNRRTRG